MHFVFSPCSDPGADGRRRLVQRFGRSVGADGRAQRRDGRRRGAQGEDHRGRTGHGRGGGHVVHHVPVVQARGTVQVPVQPSVRLFPVRQGHRIRAVRGRLPFAETRRLITRRSRIFRRTQCCQSDRCASHTVRGP